MFGLLTFQSFYAAYDEVDPYLFILSLIIFYIFICIYSLYEEFKQNPISEIPGMIQMRNSNVVTAL